jgi:molybdate transport system permease protein
MWHLSPTESAAFALSLQVAAESVALCLIPGLCAAVLLAKRHWRGRLALDAIIHLPLVLPPVLVGYLLLVVFGARAPVGHWLYARLGVHLPFTSHGAALATAVMTLPLLVRAMRLSLEQLDPGLDDAARLLGATRWDRFATITLPLMLPGILAGTITAFAASLGEFGAVITFAGNVPGETQTLPLALYSALASADGESAAWRLAGLSLALGIGGLVVAELIARRMHRWLGR